MEATYAVQTLARPPDLDVVVPGSKSHTNRALVCAALANGTSRLNGALFADDTEAMISTLDSLGLVLRPDPAGYVIEVEGCGGHVPPAATALNVRQSGTTGRFVLPMLALGEGRYVLDGDPQLRSRPFGDLLNALGQLGVTTVGERLPIQVEGGTLAGGVVQVAGDVSSQFLSGLLLSAPCASDTINIEVIGDLVSAPYLDLTLSTMAAFGAEVRNESNRHLRVEPTGYRAAEIEIEPDASAASYFFGAAAVTGGRVAIEGLGTDTVQGDLAFVDVLEQMGATVRRGPNRTEVVGPETLHGVTVNMADFSDTAQTLAVVASFAATPTKIEGIGFIRRKETDRIGAVVAELNRRGIQAEEDTDGLTVHPGMASAGIVETYDDHRMAMSFSLLGLVHEGIELAGPGCVSKTFPNFFGELEKLGG